jgi:hypothetical protein
VEVSGQLHASAALFPRNSHRFLLDKRLGGSQSQSGSHAEEKKKSLTPAGNQTITPWSSSPWPSRYTYSAIY